MRSKNELEKLIERAEIMSKIQSEDCAGKDEWKPITSPASGFAERAELFRAIAAAMGECLPEERVGRCWCEKCIGWVWGVPCWDDGICDDWDGCAESGCPRCNEEGEPPPCGTDDPKPQWLYEADHSWGTDAWGTHPKFCPDCGAHLGEDGVARRNADAGRVEMVRQALEEWCVDGFVAEEYIRAALGPQGGGMA